MNVAEGRSPKERESRRGGRKEEPRRGQEMGWRKKPKKRDTRVNGSRNAD